MIAVTSALFIFALEVLYYSMAMSPWHSAFFQFSYNYHHISPVYIRNRATHFTIISSNQGYNLRQLV